MISGLLTFSTKGKTFKSIGTHQKFDREAYKLISPAIQTGKFPLRKQILNFEGVGGPDGLKTKGPYKADHQWDPINKIGYLPIWIDAHYKNLVLALKADDLVKAAFEAGFMAHYLTDSLTPAHHVSTKLIAAEYEDSSKMRQRWVKYGRGGLLTNHVKFEAGMASTVAVGPLRTKFDRELLEQIQKIGIKAVVEEESLRIAKLGLYQRFIKTSWTVELAKTMKAVVLKRIPQLVAAAWLSAYIEAGHQVDLDKLNTKPKKKLTTSQTS